MEKKIAIGILAFNVEKYIESVVEDLASLGLQFIIIDDASTDQTLKILKTLNKRYEIIIIKNERNIGAGLSTKKLIECAKKENYDMLLKVDGDRQFTGQDVKKIGEDAKIAIRSARRDQNEVVKKAEKSKEISEDESKKYQTEIQSKIDDYVKKVDVAISEKEKEVLSI